MPSTPPIYRPGLAALWMVGSIVAFLAMSLGGRALKGQHDVFEILFFRSVLGIVVVGSIAIALGQARLINTRHISQHITRNCVHFAGQGLWFTALMMIPLAQLFAIEFTSPIWVILLAPMFLGEALNRVKLIATGLGFAGILFVAQPDIGNINTGMVAAAASAVFFAGNIILTKRLTRGEAVISILFWQTIIQALLGMGCALWDGTITWPTAASTPWLILVGLGGLLGHLCLTNALRLAPASFVIPIDFVRLPFAALLGFALYNESIEAMVFVGAALIILGNWINIRYGAR